MIQRPHAAATRTGNHVILETHSDANGNQSGCFSSGCVAKSSKARHATLESFAVGTRLFLLLPTPSYEALRGKLATAMFLKLTMTSLPWSSCILMCRCVRTHHPRREVQPRNPRNVIAGLFPLKHANTQNFKYGVASCNQAKDLGHKRLTTNSPPYASASESS